MANTSSPKVNGHTVCVLYGLAEGPRIGTTLTSKLTDAGFNVVRSPENAECIIAHSGGCFLVPSSNSAKVILLIGLPYWPPKNTLTTMRQKNVHEFKYRRTHKELRTWSKRLFWNSVYLFNISALHKMLAGRANKAYFALPNAVLIRNESDFGCTPDIASIPFIQQPEYAQMPGMHDDCWDNPEPYITLLSNRLWATTSGRNKPKRIHFFRTYHGAGQKTVPKQAN